MKTNQEIIDLILQQKWPDILDCLNQNQWDPNSLLVDSESGRKFSLLQCALERGVVAVVKRLIELGADVNWRQPRDPTALFTASANGSEEMVDLLLAAGAAVNVKTSGETALMVAAAQNHKGIVRKLLQAGAQPAERTPKGLSALSHALRRDNIDAEMVSILLDAGCPVDGRDLHIPVSLRELQVVQMLLARNSEVNARYDWVTAGTDVIKGDTPLLVAVTDTALEAFHKAGSPLGSAKPAERLAIVELLLAAGADVNARRLNNGFTPLICAALFDEAEIAERLIRAGADPAQEFECKVRRHPVLHPRTFQTKILSAKKMALMRPRNKKIRKLLLGTENNPSPL